jgi:hypothetical protein
VSSDAYDTRVLAALDAIRKDVAEIKAELKRRPTSGAERGGGVASDEDLDGERGDPSIRFDPNKKYWDGGSFVGYRFSETTPEYLDAVAKYLDACAYMAEKGGDEKKRAGAKYKRLDSLRARGWARRLRSNQAYDAKERSNGAAVPNVLESRPEDDIPF